ncbi:hypothetical protein, partial [Modestobacter versicolor]
MRVRSAVAAAVLAATVSVPLAGTAAAADLDCADFPNQAAAQVVLDADPTDPNDLDGNDNGQACEAQAYGSVAAAPVPATPAGQVAARPAGAVAAGDGSSAGPVLEHDGSPLRYVVGGLAFAVAGGA